LADNKHTGEKADQSGIYKPSGGGKEVAISKGDTFPPSGGKAADYVGRRLLAGAPSTPPGVPRPAPGVGGLRSWGVVPDVPPMLADRGIPRSLAGWVVEPKFDGWRVRVLVDAPGVRVMTRGGMDITERVPELRPLRIHPVSMVLDGELVADGGRSQDFYALTPRLRKRRDPASPGLAFVAFDLLWLDGKSLCDWPAYQRRVLLEAVELPAAACVTARWPGSEAARLIEACDELGVEGIVLKRGDSLYRPGQRSADWRKVKVAGWAQEHMPRRGEDHRRGVA
jgi:hypothetical protein